MVDTRTLFMNLGVSYRVAELMLWPPFMVMTRRDWRGTENLGTHGEGIVVAPNHISFLDPLIMAHFLHDNGRPPRFMGKQSVFEVPLAGQLIRGAGQIPVSRDKDPHKALAAAVAAVRSGECLVMYPEGTITRDPGTWPMSGKTGALRVALETGAPLIPIAQWGANKIMPPYTTQLNVLPPKTMQVTAGPPLDIEDLRGRRITKALLEEGTDRLMDAITGLLEEIRGESAPEQRLDWAAEQKRAAAHHTKEES
ncbi:MAG TPA: lysophospholipid acyltransferase family protein [Candidatus Limnocylindrales bacterium]|nr:lysophospholipid acyltransferase family protein [Candidatus Limnocylindrales bacterium]